MRKTVLYVGLTLLLSGCLPNSQNEKRVACLEKTRPIELLQAEFRKAGFDFKVTRARSFLVYEIVPLTYPYSITEMEELRKKYTYTSLCGLPLIRAY